MCLRLFNACTIVFISSFESAYVYLRNLIARFFACNAVFCTPGNACWLIKPTSMSIRAAFRF